MAIHTTPRRKRIQWPCPLSPASIKGLGFSVRRCVGVGLGTEAEPRLRSPAARPEGAQGECLSDGLVVALQYRSLLDRGWRRGRADPSEIGDLHRCSHVVVVGIADPQNHHLRKGELILAGALGNHQGPCCLVRIHYLGRRMWVQVAAVQLEGGGTLAGRSAMTKRIAAPTLPSAEPCGAVSPATTANPR